MSMESKLHRRKIEKSRYLWVIPILALLIAESTLWLINNGRDILQSPYTAAVADSVTADTDEVVFPAYVIDITKQMQNYISR